MRLIDLDTLKQNLCGDCTMDFPKECRQIGCTKVDKQDILEALRLPIVDAVPVIRCRECRWGREACGNIECHVDLNIPSEYHGYDWYCPNGERKEHETD